MSNTDIQAGGEKRNNRPWAWVPSLYFAEGIPYVLVVTLSVIFYKRMGLSNTELALYTSWLYLPWVLKFLWGPVVDMLKTKRFWILIMQLFIGAGLAGVALTIPADRYLQYTLAFFWLLAFSSATHDIAADGFYMLGLSKSDQAFFVGIRSTFYRFAMLTGQGLLVILAGSLEARTGLPAVEIEVKAIEGSTVAEFNPEQIGMVPDADETYFLSDLDIEIGLEQVATENASTLIQSIDQWNISNGFYEEEEDTAEEKSGWWKKNIVIPLETFIQGLFSKQEEVVLSETSGNISYTWFQLSTQPEPGDKIVLNFSFDGGDKSIKLVREYRFEFDESNWDKPAFAAFQLDNKLEEESSASFVGLSGNIRFAWTIVFLVIAILFAGFHIYHRFALPRPESDVAGKVGEKGFWKEFFLTFAAFFKQKQIGLIVLFLLLYRLGESQLVKLASPFLLDSQEANGLGLTTGEIGLIYGTIGIIALTIGGIIGGIAASRKGLKFWLWWMVGAMNLPNLVYVYLSYAMPDSLWIIGASVAVEQFGYGFGFTAYMLFMIYVSEGEHKTSHFALTTAFMAFGMMIPGMVSGWLQELIGYQNFFLWVMICTIPILIVTPFIKIDPKFGKKES